jgi:F-type H+-transporting ATPase subunit gamma
MQDLERVQGRLARIGAIQPVLAALRTISLASWRTALRERDNIRLYASELERATHHLPVEARRRAAYRPPSGKTDSEEDRDTHRAVLAIGSERGLCGRFNAACVERAEQLLSNWEDSQEAEVLALGSRLARMLDRRGHDIAWQSKLSLTSLPPYSVAQGLAADWLSRYERGSLDELHIVYNDYAGLGRYTPTSVRLIPVPDLQAGGEEPRSVDPAPIIETDVTALHRRLVQLLTAASLHEKLINSATAEHSTRYQLMDGASQNAERIIEELTLEVQLARQQAITLDMQELAVGAGLVGTPQD